VEAIKEGKFHIYSVGTIDEGIEVLTGVVAGELDTEGNYPEGSVNQLVQSRLDEMAAIMSPRKDLDDE
jgi:predicted ATP-dependent protease